MGFTQQKSQSYGWFQVLGRSGAQISKDTKKGCLLDKDNLGTHQGAQGSLKVME